MLTGTGSGMPDPRWRLGSEQILIELAADCHADRIPVYAVTGNVDLQRADIIDFPESTGVHVARAHTIQVVGKRVGIVHGDDGQAMWEMIDSSTCNLVFTGHTHRVSDQQVRGARVINPGAVYPAAQATVATFRRPNGICLFRRSNPVIAR